MGKSKDLTGRTFGSWEVLRRIGTNSYGKVMWMCRCVCNHKAPVAASNLLGGRSTQCRGCRNSKRKGSNGREPMDLTGRRFGSWTVLRRANPAPSKHALWECECTCGNTAAVQYSSLHNGRSTQCRSCGTRQAHATRRAKAADTTT